MGFAQLPDDWAEQRDTLRYLATHILAQARFRHDGLFDLEPSPGGLATPAVGPDRERVRISGGSLVIERVSGPDIRNSTATTTFFSIAGSTPTELAAAIGFELDAEFWVGEDTPPTRDPSQALAIDPDAASMLGDWYLFGQRVIDTAAASIPDAEASVGRVWPEHFDFGIDLAAKPGVRCNLGAAAGDGFSANPYLYVGPWDAARPGDAGYWNAPFGAVLGLDDLDSSDDPFGTATSFLMRGLNALGAA